MHKEGIKAMRVMRTAAADSSHRRADHNRDFDLAIRDIVDRRSLLNDMPRRLQNKIKKDNSHDGPAARHRRSDAEPSLRQLGDGGIAHAFLPKFSPQSPALLEIASPRPDALSDIENGGIAPHLFAQRFNPGIHIADRTFHRLRLNGFALYRGPR